MVLRREGAIAGLGMRSSLQFEQLILASGWRVDWCGDRERMQEKSKDAVEVIQVGDNSGLAWAGHLTAQGAYDNCSNPDLSLRNHEVMSVVVASTEPCAW